MAALSSNRLSTDGEAWLHHDHVSQVGVAVGLCVQVRNYEVYRLLEESLRAMLTSLPLVQVRWSLFWARAGKCVRWGQVVL
jgi:hypothetical protein